MTFEELEEKKIGIFGIGFHAHKCLYTLNDKGIDPVCFLDNHNDGGHFRGIRVLKPNKESIVGIFIVVAVSEDNYQSVRKQLLDFGLIEFVDFIYYSLINHEIALLHGNCHVRVIKQLLENSKDFSEKYSFYPMPVIMELDPLMVTDEVLDRCELFLGQDIRKENPYGDFFATERIVRKLREDCKVLIIPNLFGLGTLYFPQYKKGFNDGNRMLSMYIDGKWDPFGYFPFKDSVIEGLCDNGYEKEEIIGICESDDSITADEILACLEHCISRIRAREKKWDIKCADFIMREYKMHRLFYEPEHPTNYMFQYISNQILEKLDIHEDVNAINNLGYYEAPIYPAVYRCLGLKFDASALRRDNNTRSLEAKMGLKEYIDQYLWWHKESLNDN